MSTEDVSRRTFLRTAGGTAAAAGVATGAAGSAAGQEVPEWPGAVENGNVGSYLDARGQEEVTIDVGAGDGLAFDPTKLWVDPGTTLSFVWTGEGGDHNVETVDGPMDLLSDTTAEEGFTYTYEVTEEDEGITHYHCLPHDQVGMHAGIAVGDDVPTEDTGGGGAAGVVFVPEGAQALGIATFIAMIATLGIAFFFIRYGGARTEE